MTCLDQPGNHVDLSLDMFGGPWLLVRRKQTESAAILVKTIDPPVGDLTQTAAFSIGRSDGLVVHVREVADLQGLQSGDLERASEDILHDEGAEVPDMGRSVHGRSAAVEPEGLTVLGLDGSGLATE